MNIKKKELEQRKINEETKQLAIGKLSGKLGLQEHAR